MEKLHTLSVICSMAAALTIGAASAAPAPAAGLSSSSALADAVEFRAQVTAKAQALLSSEMPGEVSAVAFRDGERFKAGDVLVEYDCALPKARLLRAEAAGDMPEDKKQRLAIIREALMHNRMFPEKVIKYLWDDAFKFNPETLFDTDNMESLEQVIRTFVYSMGRERFKIFKPTVRASLYPDSQT